MSYPYDSVTEDHAAHVDIRKTCRNCGGRSLFLEDGWCPRCNGDDTEADVRSANLKAWDKVRRDHPEWF